VPPNCSIAKKGCRVSKKVEKHCIKAHLHIPFPHCIAFSKYLRWFVDVYGKKIITLKTQCNAENGCGNSALSGFHFTLKLIFSQAGISVLNNFCGGRLVTANAGTANKTICSKEPFK
jgi:hypothetical protein